MRPSGAYALGTWFPYLSGTHSARLESANYRASRIITGAPSRSNSGAVVREAGLPPLEVVARKEAAHQLLHYRRFQEGHPLRRLARNPERPTRIRRQRGARSCWREYAMRTLEEAGLDLDRLEPLADPGDPLPPWEWENQVIFSVTPSAPREAGPEARRRAAEEHLAGLRARRAPDVEVWTDGAAVDGVKDGGAGVVVRWSQQHRELHQDTTLSLPTGRRTDSAASEVAALAAGLRLMEEALGDSAGAVIWTLFDSRALHGRLQNPEICHADHPTVAATRSLRQLSSRHTVVLVWIPGHAGLEHNEEADQAAKEGCRKNQDGINITAAAARAQLREAVEGGGQEPLRGGGGGRPHPPGLLWRGSTASLPRQDPPEGRDPAQAPRGESALPPGDSAQVGTREQPRMPPLPRSPGRGGRGPTTT